MRLHHLRKFTLFVLLMGVVTLSGLPATVSAALSGMASSCCEADNNGSRGETTPCSAVDCSCSACLFADTVNAAAVHMASFERLCAPSFVSTLHLKTTRTPLDYPPEKAYLLIAS